MIFRNLSNQKSKHYSMAKKPRLIILSDIWGNNRPIWAQNLSEYFHVQYYDSRSLAEVPLHLKSEKETHLYFIQNGIRIATKKIRLLEKEPIYLIGFSMGGVIGWKASLTGLKTTYLYCISSTRLRLESHRPNIPIALFYGAMDTHAPNKTWFEKHQIQPRIIPKQGHQVYLNDDFFHLLLAEIIED